MRDDRLRRFGSLPQAAARRSWRCGARRYPFRAACFRATASTSAFPTRRRRRRSARASPGSTRSCAGTRKPARRACRPGRRAHRRAPDAHRPRQQQVRARRRPRPGSEGARQDGRPGEGARRSGRLHGGACARAAAGDAGGPARPIHAACDRLESTVERLADRLGSRRRRALRRRARPAARRSRSRSRTRASAGPNSPTSTGRAPASTSRCGPTQGDDRLGITGTFCAIAETGTLVVLAGAATPTATTLLPDTHIAVVRADRIVSGMEEAFALVRFEKGQTPRAMNMISGPSRTGDVEQTIVLARTARSDCTSSSSADATRSRIRRLARRQRSDRPRPRRPDE